MASGKIGLGGFELTAVANRSAVSLTASVRNGLWRRTHAMARALLVRKRATPPGPRSIAADQLAQETSPERRAILEKIKNIEWYHSLDLGHSVVTPGEFDHRPILAHYGLPESLKGLRVLDVGTWDGFWAFEFERRGAEEVVAADVEYRADMDMLPADRSALTAEQRAEKMGKGFRVAREILNSRVQHVAMNVHELSPERLGTFDIVHIGDVLVHVINPLRALQCVRSVTSGYAMISESFVPEFDETGGECRMEYLGGEGNVRWWKFSLSVLLRMIEDAGFSRLERVPTFRYGVQSERGSHLHHTVVRAYPGS